MSNSKTNNDDSEAASPGVSDGFDLESSWEAQERENARALAIAQSIEPIEDSIVDGTLAVVNILMLFIVYKKIGNCHLRAKNYPEAVAAFQKAVAFLETYKAKCTAYADSDIQHKSTAGIHHDLGVALYANGDIETAEEALQTAIEIRKSALGECADTASSYTAFADCLVARGEFLKAIKMYSKSLSILKSELQNDHPHTVAVARKLASAETKSNMYNHPSDNRETMNGFLAAVGHSEGLDIEMGQLGAATILTTDASHFAYCGFQCVVEISHTDPIFHVSTVFAKNVHRNIALLDKAIRLNYFQQETRGALFSLDPERGDLMYIYTYRIDKITSSDFVRILGNFVDSKFQFGSLLLFSFPFLPCMENSPRLALLI